MFILKWVGSHEHIIIFRKPLLLPQTCIYTTHFKAALRNSFTKLEDCERVWIVEIIRSNYALWALSSEPENTDQPTAALYNGPAPHHRIEDRRLEGIPIHKIIKLIPNINEIKMKPLHNGFKSQCQFHEICSVKGKVWVHPYLCQSDTVEVTARRRRCWIPDTTDTGYGWESCVWRRGTMVTWSQGGVECWHQPHCLRDTITIQTRIKH